MLMSHYFHFQKKVQSSIMIIKLPCTNSIINHLNYINYFWWHRSVTFWIKQEILQTLLWARRKLQLWTCRRQHQMYLFTGRVSIVDVLFNIYIFLPFANQLLLVAVLFYSYLWFSVLNHTWTWCMDKDHVLLTHHLLCVWHQLEVHTEQPNRHNKMLALWLSFLSHYYSLPMITHWILLPQLNSVQLLTA